MAETYARVGIEGGQDTSLDTLPVAFGDQSIGSFSVDELLQGAGGLEELLLGLCPVANILRAVRCDSVHI